MEKDISKSADELLGITTTALPETILKKITEPSAVATLEHDLLLEISKISSKNVVYPLLCAMKDRSPGALADLLSRPEVIAESAFITCASQMYLFAQNQGPMKLVDSGIKFEKNESNANAYLLRVLKTQPAKLAEAMREVADEKSADSTRNWFPYQIATRDVLKKLARVKDSDLCLELEEHFVSRGFGEFVSVMPFTTDDGWGRYVKHGVHRNTREVLNLQEQPNYARDRYTKSDILLVVPDASTFFVGTQHGKDASAYSKKLGAAIGEPNAFLQKQTTDLSVFLSKTLGNRLVKLASELKVQKVLIREAWIGHGVRNRTRLGADRGGCVTDQPDFAFFSKPANRMERLTLRICFDYAGKDFVDFEVKNGSISMQSNSDPVLLASALARLEAWIPYNDG